MFYGNKKRCTYTDTVLETHKHTLCPHQIHAHIFISLTASLSHAHWRAHTSKQPRSDFAMRMSSLSSLCQGLEKPHCRGQFEYEDSNRCVASAPCWHAGRGGSVCSHGWTQLEFMQHTLQWQRNWQTEASYMGSWNSRWNTEGGWMYSGNLVYVYISK